MSHLVGVLLDGLIETRPRTGTGTVAQWKARVTESLISSYDATRKRVLKEQPTGSYLCQLSRNVYMFIKKRLKVPLHKGIIDHPTYNSGQNQGKDGIGSQISKVYLALRKGSFQDDAILYSW